ncbi:hypothetical protein ACKI1H_23180 [Pseudomonas sp. YH-1]|uniref:hypothetical protein n=1 Tax=Pseudomonas sp. YH-1 TaxID=3384787 RepID=UPI003F7EE76D
MRRLVLLLLLLPLFLPLPARAAEPEVKVRTRLLPADSVLVGGTLTLQVDLLVDTWFSQPPELPKLTLDGAVVSEANGEATHLNEQIEGKAFFGLRFNYQITPQKAQEFVVPALNIGLQPGQASAPVTVQTPVQHFSARPPAGGSAGDDQRLVATAVTFTQTLQASHDPLRVGDSVTRHLRVEAEGAQAMLIPPPLFAEVPGLKRYVQSPTVKPLSDGRGGVTGGMREDAVTYVVAREGEFVLPAIELQWWQAGSGAQQASAVPLLKVSASGNASYQAPFSISDDLRELGRRTQVRIAGHWLALAATLVLLAALAYAVYAWGGPLRAAARAAFERRRQAWRDSPAFAWRQVRQQLKGEPPQVGALYLWLRRTNGCREMSAAIPEHAVKAVNPLLAFLKARYGRAGAQPGTGPGPLIQALPAIQRELGQGKPTSLPAHALKPLNP